MNRVAIIFSAAVALSGCNTPTPSTKVSNTAAAASADLHWWAETYGKTCKATRSPADFYKERQELGQPARLTEKGDTVAVEWFYNVWSSYTYYRSESDCEAVASADRAASDAEKKRIEQYQ